MTKETWPKGHPATKCPDKDWVSGVGSVCKVNGKRCKENLRNAECEKGYTIVE